MRGRVDEQTPLFHVFDLESRIGADHPLRDVKRRVDRILDGTSAKFSVAYSRTGRPSAPPERLLKALLLTTLYSVRSERQLCEAIDVNLLYRWFLDMQPSEEAFDATTFTHNRWRLDEATDGNGFTPSNPDVDFHGQKRTNETHQSRTDPEAKLYRKGPGKEAKLSHMGHTVAENRHGLILNVTVTQANGTAERQATLAMRDELKTTHQRQPKRLGADKGYDAGEFFAELESREIEPHIRLVHERGDPDKTPRQDRKAVLEARRRMQARRASEGYRLSQKRRKKIEEGFGWFKTIAGLEKSRVVGRWKRKQLLEIGAAAYNLIRLRKLRPA